MGDLDAIGKQSLQPRLFKRFNTKEVLSRNNSSLTNSIRLKRTNPFIFPILKSLDPKQVPYLLQVQAATPKRKDGHHPIIFMQCGALINAENDPTTIYNSSFNRAVVIRETGFTIPAEAEKPAIHELYQSLSNNNDRNQRIAADIEKAASDGHYPLVLTERVEHIEALEKLLSACPFPKVVLKGGMGKKQLKAAKQQLQSNEGRRILIATGRYIGEGFDDSRLDTLFLALPISWTGTLQQYVGRLHRSHSGKAKVTVYDYVDSQVPTLARMFKRRSRGYRALGYEIGPAHR
jgi:superfamily II DNA or RNA helicase